MKKLLLVILLFTNGLFAVVLPILKTGQIVSYDTDGTKVPYGTIKDDGYYQSGIEKKYTRDDNTSIVTDYATGLMWQDDENVLLTDMNLNDSLDYCSDLTLGGYSDWKLPTIYELNSIHSEFSGAFNMHTIFQNIGNGANKHYWSSTSRLNDTSRVWTIGNSGFAKIEYLGKLNNESNTRCVRGSIEKLKLKRNNNENIIFDKSNGLVWEDTENNTKYQSDEAIEYCENLNLANNSNWRLPNINELESLVDFNSSTYMYPEFKNISSYNSNSLYLSSTNIGSTYLNNGFLKVDFTQYSTIYGNDSSGYYVRCVNDDMITISRTNLGIKIKTIHNQNEEKQYFLLSPINDNNSLITFVFVDNNDNEIIPDIDNLNITTSDYKLIIKPNTDFYGDINISNIFLKYKINGILSKDKLIIPSLTILQDTDYDGIINTIDNDDDNDGVLDTNDSNPIDNKTFITDSDNDGYIDSTLNTNIFNNIYTNYKFDSDFYSLKDITNKSIVSISNTIEFSLNSNNTKDKLLTIKAKLLNSPTNNKASTLLNENTYTNYLNFNHAEFASLNKSLIYDISYDQFEPHLIKKYNLINTSSTSSIALSTHTSSPQTISVPMKGKLTKYKNIIWLKPDVTISKKVSKYKLLLKLQDDPSSLLKMDNNIDTKIKVSIFEGIDVSIPLGYKEIDPTDDISIDLVLEQDKDYLIKIESTNIKQMLFYTALIEQDDVYFEKVVLDENGELKKDIIIPLSSSYELILNSYKTLDAKLYKNGNTLKVLSENKFYSKTHLDLNAFKYSLEIKGKPNQEIDLVMLLSNELNEIEPNDKIVTATKIMKSSNEYEATIDKNDIDIFSFKKSSDGDLEIQIETNSTNNGKYIDLLLIDSYGGVLDEYYGVVSNGIITYSTSIDSGLYYIKIITDSANSIDYKLKFNNMLFDKLSQSRYEQAIAKLYFKQLKGELLDHDISSNTNNLKDAGNLIILTGDSDNPTDPLYLASQKLSKTFYTRFSQRGLSDDDIFWLNYNNAVDIDNDGQNDIVVDSSNFGKVKFYDTIKTWAKDTKKTGPLYIYMVDHGANGAFKISSNDKDNDGQKEIVYAKELVNAIDTFVEASSRDVYIIIEACKSGSFIPSIQNSSNSDKIAIITSSQASKFSYIDKFGNVSFTKFIADELLSGKTIYKAFEDAKTKLSNQNGVYKNQIPMMFASSDSLKNTSVGGNFSVAGISLTSIDNIYINSIEDNSNIDITTNKNIKVNAKITADSGITKVWTTIIPPDFTTALDDDFTTPDLSPYTSELSFNSQTQQFETTWNILSSKSYNGEYKITVYAEDTDGLVYSKNITVEGSGEEDYLEQTDTTQKNNTLTLTNGWNLISLPSNINLDQSEFASKFPNVNTMWTYKSSKWYAYSTNLSAKSSLATLGIDTISSINTGDGFWINNDGMEQIVFSGDDYNILTNSKLTDTTKGWKLLGSGSIVDVDKLTTANTNIGIVWIYKAGLWSAYSPIEATQLLINKAKLETIDSISQGSGFWVYIK